MSVQALTWMLEHSQSKGSARCVLMSLANHVGRFGELAYPSETTIMHEANIASRNTVRAAVESLEDLGEVLVYPGEGIAGRGGTTNRYELPLVPGWTEPKGLVPRKQSNNCTASESRAISEPKPRDFRAEAARLDNESRATDRARTVLLEPTNEPKENPLTLIDGFERFWIAYPKRAGAKVGKANTRKQWDKLKPDERQEAFDGLQSYAIAKNGYPEDCERYLRHKRWVGLEVETLQDRDTRIVEGALRFAEEMGMS